MMLESAGVHHDDLGSILAGDRDQSAICITEYRGNVVGDIRMCAEVFFLRRLYDEDVFVFL